MLGKKSLVQIVTEAGAIDPDLVNRASIRKTGGMSKERIRRKAPGERTRVKAVGGGKFEPVVQKDRKDMGKERKAKKAGEFQAAPEKERGSAEVKQTYADKAKEERRKAAQARIAAKKAGGVAPAKKSSETELKKSADTLLGKKQTEKKPVSPDYKPREHSGYSRKERVALNRSGEKKLKGIMSDQERDKAKKKGETVGPQEIKRRVNKRMAN